MSGSRQKRVSGDASTLDSTNESAGLWLDWSMEERRSAADDALRRGDVAVLLRLTEAYLQRRTGGITRSRHTLRAYRRTIELLLRHLAGRPARRLDARAVQRFLDEIGASGASQSTLKVHAAALRGLCGALHWAGLLEADPCLGLRVPAGHAAPRRRRESYSEEEQAQLLAVAEPADTALIRLLQSGLTVSEAVSLRWNDVDPRRGLAHVRAGPMARDVRLAAPSADAIRALGRRRSGPLLGFATDVRARQRIERLATRAGIRYRGLRGLNAGPDAAPARSPDAQLAARLTAGLDAFNRRDFARLAGCFAPGVTLSEPATGSSVHGVEAVVAVLMHVVDAFADARAELINHFATGHMVFAEIVWTGAHKGSLITEHGVIPPTGRRVSVPSYLVVSVERALVTRIHAYVDKLEELSQLGVLHLFGDEERGQLAE